MKRHFPSLHDITIPEICQGLDQGHYTSTDLVRAYIARIKQIDHEYHSVIEINPDALNIAQVLDAERVKQGRRGPLHGLPILLKDNISTLDCMETTCGSLALVGSKPPEEAAITTALRKAGAIILGKANMAEWAGFRSTSGCSGWSARGGQTKGVYYPGMKASGCSSGNGIATALGLCFTAIGTETHYSITSPAEKSGVVGFKPTRNLLPSEGIIYASHRYDTVGVLTRTVTDAVIMCAELVLWRGNCLTERQLEMLQNVETAESSLQLSGMRIGIPKELHELEDIPSCKHEAFVSVVKKLQDSGAVTARFGNLKGAEEFEALSQEERQIVLDTDMKIAINAYLSALATNPHNIQSLDDVIEFLKTHPEEEYPKRNVESLERARATNPSNSLYQSMLKKDIYFAGEGGILSALDRYNCDVLLIPTLSVTMQSFGAMAGSPVMSVPMGIFPEGIEVERDPRNGLISVAPGIPFSSYIFGRADRDEDVLRVGYVVEQLTKVRNKLQPYLEPRTEIGNV